MPVVLASFAAVSLDMTCKGDVFLGLLIELAVRCCDEVINVKYYGQPSR